MNEPQTPSSDRDSPYADHPVLSALPADVRQRIADQIARDRKISAIKTLMDFSGSELRLKEAKDIIDSLPSPLANAGKQTTGAKLASGKIDKAGTTLKLYQDGTFTTTKGFFVSEPDPLVGFSHEIDSMRRKSIAGRGAAAVVTTGLTGAPLSFLASNNRGVLYVTVTGRWSGSKTYTSRNPDDKTLSSVRSLQAAADALLASPPTAVTTVDRSKSATAQDDSDIATQLKTLAELHATGALTDDEFVAAKTRLLS